MRLINADELLKYMETTEISQYIDEINKVNDNYSSTTLYGYIKEMPTAHDVDKICRKINENKDMDNLIDADHATKIVKSGGIE